MFDVLGSIIGVLVSLGFVLGAIAKGRANAQKRAEDRSAHQQREQQRLKTARTTAYAPTAAPAITVAATSAAPVVGQIHLSQALPDKPPPAVRRSEPEEWVSTEGMELHPPGFHGEPMRLQKEDLGKLRARQSAYTAGNLAWKPPAAAETGTAPQSTAAPVYTAAQLREAIVLREILDAPVSRRRARRTL